MLPNKVQIRSLGMARYRYYQFSEQLVLDYFTGRGYECKKATQKQDREEGIDLFVGKQKVQVKTRDYTKSRKMCLHIAHEVSYLASESPVKIKDDIIFILLTSEGLYWIKGKDLRPIVERALEKWSGEWVEGLEFHEGLNSWKVCQDFRHNQGQVKLLHLQFEVDVTEWKLISADFSDLIPKYKEEFYNKALKEKNEKG